MSPRERRRWLAAGAVVAVLAGSLVWAEQAARLASEDAADALFGAGFGALVIAVAVLGRRSSSAGAVALALGVGSVVVLGAARVLSTAERTHLVEYGALAVFVRAALVERARGGRDVPSPAGRAVLAAACVALADELAQAVLPDRRFDVADLGFDLGAAMVAVAVVAGVERASAGRAG